jgi:glycosyltransferase involved in cell wall biosynthesis
MKGAELRSKSVVAFLFPEDIQVPANLREYYVSEDLFNRGFGVRWFYASRSNFRFDHDFLAKRVLSRKVFRGFLGNYIIHPVYLAKTYLHQGIRIVWISGWSERSLIYLIWYVLLLRICRIRVVYDPIDPIYEYAIATHREVNYTLLKKTAAMLLYSLVDLVIVVNDVQKRMLVANGCRERKLRVGFYGANIDFFRNRENQRLTAIEHLDLQGKFLIGWIGHMSLFKGLEEILVPLIRTLREEIPNVHFFIAGAGNRELMNRFVSLEKEGVYPLTVMGQIPYEELYGITCLMNVYVVPTKADDQYSKAIFPIKIFDAISCGVPVVTTRTPLAEEVGMHFDSICFADFDYRSYRQEILKIYCNYDMYKSMATKSMRNIAEYSSRLFASKIADYIEKEVTRDIRCYQGMSQIVPKD